MTLMSMWMYTSSASVIKIPIKADTNSDRRRFIHGRELGSRRGAFLTFLIGLIAYAHTQSWLSS